MDWFVQISLHWSSCPILINETVYNPSSFIHTNAHQFRAHTPGIHGRGGGFQTKEFRAWGHPQKLFVWVFFFFLDTWTKPSVFTRSCDGYHFDLRALNPGQSLSSVACDLTHYWNSVFLPGALLSKDLGWQPGCPYWSQGRGGCSPFHSLPFAQPSATLPLHTDSLSTNGGGKGCP